MAQRIVDTAPEKTLTVPGAQLHYTVSGSGPVLLLIPGGAAAGDIFVPVVDPLAQNYTVVRYDPRGISRSRITGAAEDVPIDVHADDAWQLLQAVGDEPAFVLGSSGGAMIALALAERHPGSVRTVVAHEPPVFAFLPTDDPRRDGNQTIYDTYLKEGAGPAIGKFMAITGLGAPASGETSPRMQEAMAPMIQMMQQNVDFFLAHYLMPVTTYVPDLARLRQGSVRLEVGVGEDSGGQLAHDAALALAERLGASPVTFPGGHAGYVTHPEAFAAKLDEVLRTS